jgi:hypothetical protein
MELWYWHHSYLVTAEELAKSKALVDRAAAAGYTGLASWDSSWVFVDRPDWNADYLKQFVAYAHAKGLAVMPSILPYGHSDDILRRDFNWAEGQRVLNVKFRRDGGLLRHVPGPVIPLEGEGRFLVEPWHQYRVKFEPGAVGSVGAVDTSTRRSAWSDDARPGATEFVFNSAASTELHVYGPTRFTMEETALVKVVKREGAPLKVYDEGRVYREGADYSADFHVPEGSTIRDGATVAMDYYAIVPVNGEGLGVCLTEPAVQRYAAENARKVAGMLPAGSGLFLGHDEMRHMNSCASCRAMGMSAGQLLAWSLRGLLATMPKGNPISIWSDMFDPWHGAVEHYYYVEGDLRGSPSSVTVFNWNEPHRRASLRWFAGRGNSQVIAGYYDPADHDGERSARSELFAANGIRGVKGLMYTTWVNDYSQLEAYARGARAQWAEYLAARPW